LPYGQEATTAAEKRLRNKEIEQGGGEQREKIDNKTRKREQIYEFLISILHVTVSSLVLGSNILLSYMDSKYPLELYGLKYPLELYGLKYPL